MYKIIVDTQDPRVIKAAQELVQETSSRVVTDFNPILFVTDSLDMVVRFVSILEEFK